MADARVAIIMRTQNRPLTLDRAVRSILGQRFHDWQLVLVSDAGNLQVINEVISRHAAALGSQYSLLHRQQSTGMEAASNYGIAQSRSQYLVMHDDDDGWHPDFLAKTVGLLDSHPEYRGVAVGTEFVVERIDNGRIVELRRERLAPPPKLLTVAALRRRNRYPPIAFLYDRKAYEAIGGYREDLRALGDWAFNVRFAERFKIGQIPDYLAHWHHRPRGRGQLAEYANSPYRHHLDSLMRLKREWGEMPPFWRYLLWWRY